MAIKCKPYSEITVECWPQLITVHICSVEIFYFRDYGDIFLSQYVSEKNLGINQSTICHECNKQYFAVKVFQNEIGDFINLRVFSLRFKRTQIFCEQNDYFGNILYILILKQKSALRRSKEAAKKHLNHNPCRISVQLDRESSKNSLNQTNNLLLHFGLMEEIIIPWCPFSAGQYF